MREKSRKFEAANPPASAEIAEPEILDVELKDRLERLRTMGRVIGDDFAMGVEVGRERGWRYIFKPVNKIEVDPVDVKEKGLDYCLGVIAHEGAHRKISRTDFIPKKIWQEMGFSYLMNAVEDPRVNNWVRGKYDGARDWLSRVYAEDLPTEDRIDRKAKQKLGYTPKHIQYGLEVIRYWHQGEFSESLPEDVAEALKDTIKFAELAYETLPAKDPKEEDIEEQAKNMYKIVYSAIWPEYQKLVDQAFEDEALRQMLKEMIEKGEIELGEEGKGGNGEPLPLDQMPEDLRRQLKKKIKEKLEGLSEEERKKMEEKAEAKAEEALDGLETDLNQEIKGKFSPQPETVAEEKERKEGEAKDQAEAKERAKEIREAKKEIEKKLEAERSEYDKALETVKPYIDKVAEDIMNLFITKRFPHFKKSFPGQKLRLKGAMEWRATKEYRELFERRLPTERQDYNFLLLVDLSGSMSGEKIQETFKGAVLFAEALNRVAATLGGLKVAIHGFQDELIPYKDFAEELDDDLRQKMSSMKREVSNQGEHNRSSYNNDGYALKAAAQILEAGKSRNQFLFVLSDGQPAEDNTHRVPEYQGLSQEDELRSVIKDISQAGQQKILGIGLGKGTEHVADYYRNDLPNVENIPNVDVKKLSEVLGQKLKELIK